MKYILITLLSVILSPASARNIDMPSQGSPALDASDIAWMEGIVYTKGLLPNIEDHRLKSVRLVLDYESGKQEVVIDSMPISYYEGDSEEWMAVVGELLVSVTMSEGRHEIFLGYTTAELSTQKRKKLKIRGVGLPAMVTHFQGRTGHTTDDIGYVVPKGESKVFTFVKDGEPYAYLKLIAN